MNETATRTDKFINAACDNCGAAYKIAEAKIPAGKTVLVKCARCGGRFKVTGREASGESEPSSSSHSKGHSDDSAPPPPVSEELLEQAQEHFDPDTKVAIIMSDTEDNARIKDAIASLGYIIREVKYPQELEMRFRVFNYELCVFYQAQDSFTHNNSLFSLIKKASELPADTRRRTFFLLCQGDGNRHDTLKAFSYSVDLVISHEDIEGMGSFLPDAIKAKALSYKAFFEVQKEMQGKKEYNAV